MFDGLFLLICHCTRSIFFPFNILAGLRIKSCVSPYSLDEGIFLVFLNRHKHRICRTHTIVHATIKISRSWQDSMISLSVFFSVLLLLVEEQDLSDDISGTFNRPPYRYPSLTHSKRNESIRLVTSLRGGGGALPCLNPLISLIYIRAILESHITIRDGKFKHANWLRSHSDMSCHGSREAQRTLVSSPGFVCTWASVSSLKGHRMPMNIYLPLTRLS